MPTVYASSGGAIELTKILSNTGGQSDVYHLGDSEAAKLPHTPSDDEARKLVRLITAGAYRAVENVATIPTGLLYNSRKLLRLDPIAGAVGYRMRLAKDCVPLDRILDIDDQRRLGLSLHTMVELFIELHEALCSVHRARFVVGDFHAHNIMVNLKAQKGRRIVLIDVDGWGYCSEDGGEHFPVMALAGEVEHPRLQTHGTSSKAQHRSHFERDWFGFALHLANGLTGMAPYTTGGVPGVTSEQERKKRGLTIMSRQVRLDTQFLPMYQRMGKCTEDILCNWLTVAARGEFPIGVLTQYLLPNIVRCRKCDFETRATYWCPKCGTEL